MKRNLMLAVLVFLLSAPPTVMAGGSSPTSGFKVQPALEIVTPTTVGVMWETINSDTGVVKVALNRNMTGAKSISITTQSNTHKISITGLNADTTYYYTVTSDGDTSGVGSFMTALQKGSRLPFRFIVYGDSRQALWYEALVAAYGDNDDHLAVCQSMNSYAPDFVVHVGDFEADGTDMGDIYNFFSVESGLLASNPVLPTYGNHEFSGGSTAANTLMDNYLIPAAGGTFSYYSYNYGNVHILTLCTGDGVWATDNFDLLKPGSAEYNFAAADLAAAHSDPAIDFIFVAMHVPPYSCANFGDNTTLSSSLDPLFIANHVTAVFMGHEHDYQHLKKNGIDYILTGGAGSPIMDLPWVGNSWNTKATLLKYDQVLNYVIADVAGRTANFQVRKVQGDGSSSSSVLESFSLTPR